MSRKRRTVADEPFVDVRSAGGAMLAGQRIVDHAHEWHQLLSVTAGLMTVTTEVGAWTAPPHWAIWIPAHVRHSIRFVGASRFASLYVRPGRASALPDRCTALAISPLLAALIDKAHAIGMLDRRDVTEWAIAMLIAAELQEIPVAPFTLPQPRGEAMRRVTERIADQQADRPGLALPQLATAAGIGLRTLERHFLTETGMTIGQWRRHRLLLIGLETLAAGGSVKAAAAAAGYATPSAFVAAFRQSFGVTPGRYFSPDIEEPVPGPQQPSNPAGK